MKSRWLDGRLEADVSAFHMNFENLVIAQSINGLPSLANAGTETFDGLEGAAVDVVCTERVCPRDLQRA